MVLLYKNPKHGWKREGFQKAGDFYIEQFGKAKYAKIDKIGWNMYTVIL